jgi:lipoic acid synthetase
VDNVVLADAGRRAWTVGRKPKREIPAGPIFSQVNDVLNSGKLSTICVSGKCPNRGECFSRGSLAFMILGEVCTRHCGFCAVKAGDPKGIIDWEEPKRLAQAAASLKLRHIVITSVARDDLQDGGASVFEACIQELRRLSPTTIIEVLVPDFCADPAALDTVLHAEPDIFNHNVETVERLSPTVRSKATYRRSLKVLEYAMNSSASKTKSGFMLGLGETKEEVLQTLQDLRSVGCEYLTIGQYLQPSRRHLAIESYVPREDFRHWEQEAFRLGFERVASGPLVRSSYFADQLHGG